MTTEIFVENNKIDITSDIESLLTFSVDDIKDFSSRNTTFSKTINIPGTIRNNRIFGHIFDTTVLNPYDSTVDNVNINFNPSVQADCIIFQDHLQIFKGTLRILQIVITNNIVEYEVAVFGEMGGLVASIGTNKLEDLDFSAYDQTWNISNVSGSWTQMNASGVCYPLIDYGTVSTNKVDYDIRAFRPALYVREYIDKIFTNAGYSWSCDLFNTARFKGLIIPNNQKDLYKRTSSLQSASGTSQNINPASGYTMLFGTRSGTGFTYSAGVFTYAGTVGTIVDINWNFTTTINSGVVNPFATLMVKKNGTTIYSVTKRQHTNYFIDTQSISLDVGDTIAFYWQGSNPSPLYTSVSGSFTASSQQSIVVSASYGDSLTINDMIPKNILQRDFLSSIVKLFNLYLYENKLDFKKIYLKPYVDFFGLNVSGIQDWNVKIDRSKPITIKPMSELNARYYNFNFKEDNDYFNELYRKTYNETYGNYNYDSLYQFTNDKKDVELIFSPTVLYGTSLVDKVVSAMYKKNAGVEEKYSTNIRILQFKKITGVTGYKITNSGSNIAVGVTSYGYAGHYDDPDAPGNDIHFGVPKELYFVLASGAINVTQFNVYWSSYLAEVTDKDSKLLMCFAKLNTKDIYTLDFSKLVYLNGSYWRLNKIEDWNATSPDVCKVELLKVINTVY